MNRIRPIAICLFLHEGRFLVGEERQSDGSRFYRPVGGGIAFGESSEQALRREIREELGVEVLDPRLLGVIENRFTHEGEMGHEIVFVYDARFDDACLYAQRMLEGYEVEIDARFRAVWLPLEALDVWPDPIYPQGLHDLVKRAAYKGARSDS